MGIKVDPGQKVLEELRKLKELEYVKTVKPENLQVDLRFFGELDESQVKELQEALQGLRFRRFSMRIQGLGVFPRSSFVRVVWAGVESGEVFRLKEGVDSLLVPLGYPPEKSFIPHLTLCRVKRKPDKRLNALLSSDRTLFFQDQQVNEVRLYQSVLKQEGPEYSVLWKVGLG